MKKFRFPLQPVGVLRAHQELRAREVFAHPVASNGWTASHLPTQWLAPLYTMTFEIAVRDQLNQMNPEAIVRNIRTQPVMFVARSGPEYAPVADVMTLAADVAGTHEVIVDKPNTPGSTDDQIWGPENLKLRQAMSLAIDRDEINQKVYEGTRKEATGVVMTGIPGYEPAYAQALLKNVILWTLDGQRD